MLLTNYIRSAWRNILRHKLFSIINIVGLAIGLAAVMLIALFVRDELSYDMFWKNADNIYRVHLRMDVPGKDTEYFNNISPMVAAALKKDFSEIKHVTRMVRNRQKISINNTDFDFQATAVDPNILNIFDFKAIYGDLTTALSDANSLIISQTQSEKLFGTGNPVGQTYTVKFFNYSKEYKITAVIEDHPKNSVINVNAMYTINLADFEGRQLNFWEGWYSNFVYTYIEVNSDTDLSDLEARMENFIDQNYPPLSFGAPGTKPSSALSLSLMNIKDLHLESPGKFEEVARGSKSNVIFFSIIAILILTIANINFMNLSTARASVRAKEVSLRKVLGAKQQNLIFQFLTESILLTLLSLMVAITIVEILVPSYGNFLGKTLSFNYFSTDTLNIMLFTVFVGVASGCYPAFILSNFRPANILRANKSSDTTTSSRFRTGLVILQFTISIFLFVSTAVIFSQMKYAEDMNLGYTKENLLIINGNDGRVLLNNLDIIVERLKSINGVSSVTYTSNFTPGSTFESMDPIRPENSKDPIMITYRGVGYDFLKTFDIPLITGRGYNRNRRDGRPSRDQLRAGERWTASIILNKSAVRRLGFGTPEQAIDKMLYMNVGLVGADGGQETLETPFRVIGVVEDAHFTSLKAELKPEFYQLKTDIPYFVALRFTGNPMDIVDMAREVWEDQMPDLSFEFNFATDSLAKQYLEERNQMIMFGSFSGLAIFIACLGLFGLVSFTAVKRTKEIGIRKIMGAKVFHIVKLLVWQFSKPVLIANIIAWPVAYLVMSRWLEGFVYRIDDIIIIALCLIAGLTTLLIAWATVAGNSYAVARQNPIKALRYE